jgi:hypothetical protein
MARIQPSAGFGAMASTSAPTRRAGSAQKAKNLWKRRYTDSAFAAVRGWRASQVRLEMFAECLHSGFGGSGIVFLVFHNQRLTP